MRASSLSGTPGDGGGPWTNVNVRVLATLTTHAALARLAWLGQQRTPAYTRQRSESRRPRASGFGAIDAPSSGQGQGRARSVSCQSVGESQSVRIAALMEGGTVAEGRQDVICHPGPPTRPASRPARARRARYGYLARRPDSNPATTTTHQPPSLSRSLTSAAASPTARPSASAAATLPLLSRRLAGPVRDLMHTDDEDDGTLSHHRNRTTIHRAHTHSLTLRAASRSEARQGVVRLGHRVIMRGGSWWGLVDRLSGSDCQPRVGLFFLSRKKKGVGWWVCGS